MSSVLVDSGIDPHTAIADVRYIRFLNATLLIFALAQFPVLALLVGLGLWVQLAVNLGALSLCGLGFVLNRRGSSLAAKVLVVAVVTINTAYFASVLGATAPTHLWLIPGAVLGVLVFKGSEWRWALALVSLAMLSFVVFEFTYLDIEPLALSFSDPAAALTAAHGSTVAAMVVTLVFVGMMHRRFARSEAALSEEKAESDQLRRQVVEARRLGQYTLGEKIGEGGMGMVYRARHGMLRRPTAIKLLRSEQVNSTDLARFEREVQMTARLSHPNTVTVFDYGRTPEDVFYYAMELLDGSDLESLVRSSGPQPPARVCHILRKVADALSEAHGIGLIHRDIKPSNIILCRHGGRLDVPKVVDFGLVREVDEQADLGLTVEGQMMGTPLYMDPEVMRSPGRADARSDLYALGAVGYYLLTGEHVFTGSTLMEICYAHINAVPVPPAERLGAVLPRALESIVMSCLEKDPSLRPQSAEDLSALLLGCDDVGTWSEDDARAWWVEGGRQVLAAESSETVSWESEDSFVRTVVVGRGES